ncbi:MAG: hypothetical protein IKD41_01380 [Alistipes sp.]|nr:hypothetical protein [Alistipes sp.]
MRGLGKRVTIGFLSIVGLLLASGIISLFELGNMSNDTESILSASRRNMEMAKDMLKSAHEHSQAVLHIALFDENSYRDVCRRTMGDLEGKVATIRNEAVDASRLDSLSSAVATLREVADNFLSTPKAPIAPAVPVVPQNDTLVVMLPVDVVAQPAASKGGMEWYDDNYKVAYDNLVDEIQEFMTHIHSSLAPRAEQLNKNAYRSVAPVLISLVVLIAIVLMFYYFIAVYCVKPIAKINKSLSDYMSYRLPFSIKDDLLDELKELVDNIERLVGLSKQNRQ